MSADHEKEIPKYLTYIIGIIMLAVAYEFLPTSNTIFGDFNFTKQKQETITLSNGYKVKKVVDGDTIDVEKEGGITRVRLLGINTPESVDPRRQVECYGKEASAYLKDLLNGETVTLEMDESQDKFDRNGRLLAYVYLLNGEMVNKKIVADGYGYEYTWDNPYKYKTQFKNAQALAKKEKRGLWSLDTCNGDKHFNK